MSYIIEREEVKRISRFDFPDGSDIVGEAVEYHISCGCRIIFGIRWKGGLMEKCVLSFLCDNHPNLPGLILEAGQKGHKMYDSTTDDVIAWALLAHPERSNTDG